MPDFKFAKGFFTGMLVTEAAVATGLLFLTGYALKTEKDNNRSLGRYNRYGSYYEYRKHERDKECL